MHESSPVSIVSHCSITPYYDVVHSRRQLLLKFQPNQTYTFILTACGSGCVRGFEKNGKREMSVSDSILPFKREFAQRNQKGLAS